MNPGRAGPEPPPVLRTPYGRAEAAPRSPSADPRRPPMLATTRTDPAAETAPAARGDDAAEYRELVAAGLAAALTEPGW